MLFKIRCCLAAVAVVVVATSLGAQDTPVYTPGDGVTLPVLVTEVRPSYTAEARDARIEGDVVLDCVVRADGTVGEVSIASSLDSVYGLDNQAVSATKQWTFKPGTKDGKAVAVRVKISMTFTLK